MFINTIKSSFKAIAAATAIVVGTLAATSAPAAAETETATQTIISEGTWTKKSFRSDGTWQIVQRGGDVYVVLSDDFRTRNAPDLKIFLSPGDAGELNGKNATDGSLLISPLTSNAGAQEYLIPAGVDLSAYTTIIIHCEEFSKLWSVATL